MHFYYSPTHPDEYNWTSLYPVIEETQKRVEFLDVGCGYGGLLGKYYLFSEKLLSVVFGNLMKNEYQTKLCL